MYLRIIIIIIIIIVQFIIHLWIGPWSPLVPFPSGQLKNPAQ